MDTRSDTIDILDINCWGSLPSPQNSIGLDSVKSTVVTDSLVIHEIGTPPPSPILVDLPVESCSDVLSQKEGKHFQVDPTLNSRVAVWCGSVAKIRADACVLPCTELLRSRQPSQSRAVFRGQPELQQDIFNTYRCATGDVKMFKTTTLPYKFVMLTPGPKYTAKYESASEITLVSCYKNALISALEHGLETLVIGRLHTEDKGYPSSAAVNIALRVTRLFLEQHGELFRKICFVLETSRDLMYYQELLPVYFPRNSSDYIYQATLPDATWGIYGEPMRTGEDGYIRAQWSTSTVSLARTLNIAQTDFALMRDDPDSVRQMDQAHQPDIYSQLLKWAREEDLSRVASCRAVYLSGYTRTGETIVLVVGRHFPSHLPIHIVESHYVQVLDPITTRSYCLVYFHTGCTGRRRDLEFLQRLLNNCPGRYRSNLSSVYSVHASTLHKLQSWMLFLKLKDLRKRTVELKTLPELFEHLPREQLQIPPFVLDYDEK